MLATIEKIRKLDLRKFAMTVYKDGTYKVWRDIDAAYARDDDNWLMEIPIQEVVDETDFAAEAALTIERISANYRRHQ